MSQAERGFNPGDSISTIFQKDGKTKVRVEARNALLQAEAKIHETTGLNLPDYFWQAAEAKISPKAMSLEVGVNKRTLARMYGLLGIPILPQGEYIKAKWQDPQYRGAITEAKRVEMIQRWQNPQYREFMAGVNSDPINIANWKEKSGEQMSRRWEDETWREKMAGVAQKRWTPEARAKRGVEAKALWQNPKFIAARQSPDFRQRLSQSIKGKYASDPEFRERNAARLRSPEMRQKNLEAMQLLWSDPTFRTRISEASRAQLSAQREDPAFQERMRQVGSRVLKDLWQKPEYRAKMQEVVRSLWLDENHRQLVSASSRSLWLDEERRVQMLQGLLMSIHGNRRDLDFYALSTHEANFARILQLLDRDFYTREIFMLKVDPEYQEYFAADETTMAVDFVVAKPRGHITLYEIMAHPFENPVGWAKLSMLIKQYPDLDIRAITPEAYRELEQRFSDKVNASPVLCGWETAKDNLSTNPEKYR